jgi:hypothetical protein
MENPLHLSVCQEHPERQSAGICMACQGSFCKECITEMNRKMYCASCLAKLITPQHLPITWKNLILQFVLALLALIVLTSVWYYISQYYRINQKEFQFNF